MRNVWIPALSSVLLLGLLTSSSALAGWFWNSRWDVEGTDVRLCWSVDGGSGPGDYRASVELAYPKGVDVELVSQMTKKEEPHKVRSKQLTATESSAQIKGTFRVTAVEGASSRAGTVNAWISLGDCGNTALASASGDLREKVVVGPVSVPISGEADSEGDGD